MSLEHKSTVGNLSSVVNYINVAVGDGRLEISEDISIAVLKEVIVNDESPEDMKQLVIDGWKQEVFVESKNGSFVVGSIGEDRQKGTSDDIIVDAKGSVLQGDYVKGTSLWTYAQISLGVALLVAVVILIKQRRG